MTLPTWNLHADPEYVRVRGLILKFFTAKSGRPYIDGKLSEDQKDDAQDAFLAYFENVLSTPDDGYREMRLYLEVCHVIKRRIREDEITVGGEVVPRRMIPVDSEGKVPEAKESGVDFDPDDEVPEPHTLEEPTAEENIVRRAEFGVLYGAMTNRLTQDEEIVLAMRLNGESFEAISQWLSRPVGTVTSLSSRGIAKIRKIITQ